MIFSSAGLHITYIDRRNHLSAYTLSSVMAQAVRPAPDTTDHERRSHDRLMSKLRFCKETLHALVAQVHSKPSVAVEVDHPPPPSSHGEEETGQEYDSGTQY